MVELRRSHPQTRQRGPCPFGIGLKQHGQLFCGRPRIDGKTACAACTSMMGQLSSRQIAVSSRQSSKHTTLHFPLKTVSLRLRSLLERTMLPLTTHPVTCDAIGARPRIGTSSHDELS